MTPIRIVTGDLTVQAALNDSRTARVLVDALPIESTARRWGAEVYFTVPVDADEEDAQADVAPGTIVYWPVGKALCLLFGQKPYSPVSVVGTIEGDPGVLDAVSEGDTIRVELA
ncbi:MAG: cyclophilin-like fold protein [Phycisphaerae bacterium]|jgi:hypothetical protein